MEEEDASKPPTSRSHPPTRAGRFAPVLTRQEEVGLFSKPRPRQARPAADAVTRADIEDTESEEEEEDLTEVSEVQEITLGTLQGYRDQSSKRNQKGEHQTGGGGFGETRG